MDVASEGHPSACSRDGSAATGRGAGSPRVTLRAVPPTPPPGLQAGCGRGGGRGLCPARGAARGRRPRRNWATCRQGLLGPLLTWWVSPRVCPAHRVPVRRTGALGARGAGHLGAGGRPGTQLCRLQLRVLGPAGLGGTSPHFRSRGEAQHSLGHRGPARGRCPASVGFRLPVTPHRACWHGSFWAPCAGGASCARKPGLTRGCRWEQLGCAGPWQGAPRGQAGRVWLRPSEPTGPGLHGRGFPGARRGRGGHPLLTGALVSLQADGAVCGQSPGRQLPTLTWETVRPQGSGTRG